MEYTSKRLPKNIKVWKNYFEEYIATEDGEVAQVKGVNVRASRTLKGAIDNYLAVSE